MSSNIKRELILEGLDCANCAAKIENSVKNINGIHNATVDFISKTLKIEIIKNKDENLIIEEVSRAARNIESDIVVRVSDKNGIGFEEHKLDRKELIIFGAGALLYSAALIFKFSNFIEITLYLISYILVGGEVVLKAAKNIVKGKIFDENFLMGLATIGAFLIGEYPEGVAVMLFYQVGEFFQDTAVNRSRNSIKALMNIRPDYANIKNGDDIIRVSPEEVKVGDIIIIKPGERVPLDGKVIEGRSQIDTSALTGESVPRGVHNGSDILSGSININGLLTVEVVREFGESTISKILYMVQNASSKKASVENFITKFARYYTPVVVIAAFIVAVVPPLFIQGSTFSEWIYRALIFLVISCPCALVISIPLGFFGGIGGASKNGILVKGSNYLEALNNVDTVVFDKTGTLTKGVFKVTQVKAEGNLTKEQLLEYAAYAEMYSNHPIATSILKAYKGKIDEGIISNYDEMPGYGIKVKVDGKTVLLGNSRLIKREKISFEEIEAAGTVVYAAIDGNYSGFIVISDELKEDSLKSIKALKEIGVKKIAMLTGDSKTVGTKVAEALEIDKVYSELLPHQKVEKIESLYKEKVSKGKLVFVGDGINDAPVLARADVGVAMGGLGSDAAIEAADIVLMTDEPSKLVNAILIARRTKAIVWQNIVFALGVKVFVLLLGAGGIATIWEAVFADVGVAVLAILNSMRVMKTNNLKFE